MRNMYICPGSKIKFLLEKKKNFLFVKKPMILNIDRLELPSNSIDINHHFINRSIASV